MPIISVPTNSLEREDRILQALSSNSYNDFQAILPTTNSTRSYWLNHPTPSVNEFAKEGSEGDLTADADICIIGSGITGISAAYHLSRAIETANGPKKFKIVILDARDFCSGATGRNGGHLAPNPFIGFIRDSALYGTEESIKRLQLEKHSASSLVQFLQNHKVDTKVDLVNGGRIEMHVTDKERIDARLDYEAVKRERVDLSGVEWLNVEYMERVHGTSFPGVRLPSHNLWPMKAVTEIYRIIHQSSLSSNKFSINLHTNTPVTSISTNTNSPSNASKRRYTLHTPRGPIQTHTILHATNAYASHLLPFLTQFKHGIIPTRGQIIATRSSVSSDTLTDSGWTGNEDFEYWFPRPPNLKSSGDELSPLVILGGGREVAKNFEIGETDDSVLNEEVGSVLRKFLPEVFPNRFERGKEPEWEWTGIMGFTSGDAPFVGPVIDPKNPTNEDNRGQYICAGYSGHGMPRAFACAEVVSSIIMHELRGATRETWIPPDWFPKHFLTWHRK